MKSMTKDNLQAAFAGESQAHMKYAVFADKAEQEGLPNVAKLFRATSYAEMVHATNHLKVLGGVKGSAANLGTAIGGETYEVEEMYPAFKAVAELQGEKRALQTMNWALEAEKGHAEMYTEAQTAVEAGNDIELDQVYVCGRCGWTGIGEPPDECPVCQAKKELFRIF
ncbi:MAG: rubrerythrin family protein [Chloroflexi bacterium]|nr:rubrerythrin family protein [Chloroflexota bacterium]